MEPTKAPVLLNRRLVREFALKVSYKKRAMKFTRVSSEFIDSVGVDLDSAIRQICLADTSEMERPEPGQGRFTTGLAAKKAGEKLDEIVRVIIHRKVMRHPTVGCTLK